jgi:hypothetical protein
VRIRGWSRRTSESEVDVEEQRARASRRRKLRIRGYVIGAVILLTIGVVGSIFDSDDESSGLITVDKIDDCREAGRDTGDRCDFGADIESTTMTVDGDALGVEFVFTEDPPLGDDIEWTIRFFIGLGNGVICGLTNVDPDGVPSTVATSFAIDPDTRADLGEERCAEQHPAQPDRVGREPVPFRRLLSIHRCPHVQPARWRRRRGLQPDHVRRWWDNVLLD